MERNPKRLIPSDRVKIFIEHYISHNYAIERNAEGAILDKGISRFARETNVAERRLYGIIQQEQANVSFEIVDRILTALDREYLWYWEPEEGGFSDYYGDDPPPPAEPTKAQKEWKARDYRRRAARKKAARAALAAA